MIRILFLFTFFVGFLSLNAQKLSYGQNALTTAWQYPLKVRVYRFCGESTHIKNYPIRVYNDLKNLSISYNNEIFSVPINKVNIWRAYENTNTHLDYIEGNDQIIIQINPHGEIVRLFFTRGLETEMMLF